MSYFASAQPTSSNCTANGCDVTIKWSFVAGASFDGVEITRILTDGSGLSIGIAPASAGQTTIPVYYSAGPNDFVLNARTIIGDVWQESTTLPDGTLVSRADPIIMTYLSVILPPLPGSAPVSFTPGKPSITNLTVEDGSLYVTWDRPSGSVDIDGYTIAVVENGLHLQPLNAKPSRRAARFSPTKPNATYDIGVAAYNDVWSWPDVWEEDRFTSAFDWRRVTVPEDRGWPPSGSWQSWPFPKEQSFAGSGRDALTAVSRSPEVLDVFWVVPVIDSLKMGKIKTAFFRDGAGWGYADLPFAPTAHVNGGIAALSRGKELVEIFWAAWTGQIYHAWWYPGTGWQSGMLVPGAGSIQPGTPIATVSRSENHMEIFWISPDGAIRNAWWYQGNTWGFGEIAPAGSASTTGGITACSRAPHTMEVFWITSDGAVDNAWWYENEAKKGWQRGRVAQPDSSAEQSRIAVVSRQPDTMELFYVARTTALKHAYFYEWDEWKHGVIKEAGVSPNGGLSVVSREQPTIEVFWTSHEFMLHNSYWYEGSTWQNEQRSPKFASNPLGPVVAVSRQPNTMEVWSASMLGVIFDHYIYFK